MSEYCKSDHSIHLSISVNKEVRVTMESTASSLTLTSGIPDVVGLSLTLLTVNMNESVIMTGVPAIVFATPTLITVVPN